MIAPGSGVRVYLATQPCDMRKGMDGLAAQVQNVLAADPFSGALFVFRGKRGDMLKILAWDGSGLCLFAKRLEQGKFVWPPIVAGRLQLTPAHWPCSSKASIGGGRSRLNRSYALKLSNKLPIPKIYSRS
ncbi:IS66 family insertion sequence element accessory protein TnpB [Bradyrhizobium lablabi]|uniref:IS66 family insertion sequence element accessory protein TnpB n=1 Tax=Bradyrhizobium lablabi TaxID=722472 RepID=UPI000B2DDD5B